LAGRGEILHGLLENTKVPRYGVRRVGPGRHGVLAGHSAPHRSDAAAPPGRAREDLRNDEGGQTFFPELDDAEDVVDMIKEGVMIGAADEHTAQIGHEYTKRQMPW
jgi:hypothetical protein